MCTLDCFQNALDASISSPHVRININTCPLLFPPPPSRGHEKLIYGPSTTHAHAHILAPLWTMRRLQPQSFPLCSLDAKGRNAEYEDVKHVEGDCSEQKRFLSSGMHQRPVKLDQMSGPFDRPQRPSTRISRPCYSGGKHGTRRLRVVLSGLQRHYTMNQACECHNG